MIIIAVTIDPNLHTITVTVGVLKTINVGKLPYGIAVNPNTNMVYVGNEISNTDSIIDGKTNTVVKTIPSHGVPHAMAVSMIIQSL
jgi:YVTN family beta-propeller protein